MHSTGSKSPLRANGTSQEWGRKRRKAEDKKGRRNRRDAAIREARREGVVR